MQCSYFSYILILIAIFAHYPYGKMLGVKSFFTGTLVGISMSGLIVGILANVCAGAIRPVLLFIVAIGIIFLVYDLVKRKIDLNISKDRALYLVLIVLGVIIFSLNVPTKTFLLKEGQETFLRFNRHYSYYSSQSVEMLNAKYFDRLRIRNIYPEEWTQYHFFNAGTQASAQALVSRPNLFTYWIAQIFIVILILISCLEILFLKFGLTKKTIAAGIIWIVVGFTIFSDSISWNLTTTGAFSVFAMVQLIFSLYNHDLRKGLIYSCILGASAFRLLPISVIAIIYLIFVKIFETDLIVKNRMSSFASCTMQKIKGNIRFWWIELTSMLLFLLYNILTIVSVSPATESEKITLFTDKLLSDDWQYPLLFYKMVGFVSYKFFHGSLFQSFATGTYFDVILKNSTCQGIFLLLAVFLVLWVVWSVFSLVKKQSGQTISYILIVLSFLFIVSHYVPPSFNILLILFAPYSLMFLSILNTNMSYFGNRFCLRQFMLILFFGTLFLQFMGLPPEVREPIAYITLDVALWSLVGLYLFSANKKIIIVATLVSIFFLTAFSFKLINIIRLDESDHHFVKVNISSLVKKDFQRSNCVDKNDFAVFDFSDADNNDAYAAILGARLDSKKKHNKFLTNNFVRE